MSKPGIQLFQAFIAQLINRHIMGSRPTDCTTCPLQQLLHMHKKQKK